MERSRSLNPVLHLSNVISANMNNISSTDNGKVNGELKIREI